MEWIPRAARVRIVIQWIEIDPRPNCLPCMFSQFAAQTFPKVALISDIFWVDCSKNGPRRKAVAFTNWKLGTKETGEHSEKWEKLEGNFRNEKVASETGKGYEALFWDL